MAHWSLGSFEIPAVAGIAAAALLILVGRFWWLRQGADRGAAAESADRDRLADLYLELRRFAAAHSGRLPSELPDAWDGDGISYRPLPSADCDPKLIVAHDAAARRQIVEFPNTRPGRLVLFWTGRVRLLTESAFEKLLAADDAMRSRLGIDDAGGAAGPSNATQGASKTERGV